MKRTPSPVKQPLPELGRRGAATFADRKTSGKTGQKCGKKEGESGGCSSMPRFGKAKLIQSSTPARVSHTMLDKEEEDIQYSRTEEETGQRERQKKETLSVSFGQSLRLGETQGGNRGRGPTHRWPWKGPVPCRECSSAFRPAVPAQLA